MLQSPDDIEERNYNWDLDFQRYILSMLFADRQFLTRSLSLVSHEYFTQRVHKQLCEILFSYFKEHHTVPDRVIILEELRSKKGLDEDKLTAADAELTSLLDYYSPGVENRDYLLEKISHFAKMEAIKNAFNSCLSLIRVKPEDDETWSKVYDKLRVAMSVDTNFDLGLNYFETVKERYMRMNAEIDNLEIFSSGFEHIDESLTGGGLRRGDIGAYMGNSGAGKSLALVRASVKNYERGKKVLYITLEMNEDDVARRFDAQITNIPIRYLTQKTDEVYENLSNKVKEYENKNLIVIKHFPSGTADINVISAYVYQCQLSGFNPDLLVVDYIGEMKDYAGMPIHESREKIIKDLRGFGEINHYCILTAVQPNRSAREAQKGTGVIDDNMMGDSYGQTRPLSALWTINCDDVEKELGVGRLWVAKQRNGKSRFYVYFRLDPDTLGMYPISKETYMGLRNIRPEAKEDKVIKFEKPDTGE